jgi:hypothetical protein
MWISETIGKGIWSSITFIETVRGCVSLKKYNLEQTVVVTVNNKEEKSGFRPRIRPL